jgi:hypothetical protein
MAEPLQGAEFRIFRSLVEEWPQDSVEQLRVEMTRGAELSSNEIQEVLESLREKGYVEEFKEGHWQVTPNGHGVRRSLLGERRAEALEDLRTFALETKIRELPVKQVRLGVDKRQDGEAITRVLLLVDDPEGETWDLPVVSELREQLNRKASQLGLPAVSISLVPESDRDSATRPVR